ncbi:hypothetical protein [Parasitella parasitica]|uniref:Integrase catalytic domain-containing protein n=1 Tax=Parasitella parasitica TaxID=35722 RepID=A0A0B7NI16_9FUNG|nr:hypothetical protein [Parasitella parasitica]
MATRLYSDKIIEPPSFEAVDLNGEKQSYTSSIPSTADAGKKDPYRVCVNYKPVNKVMLNSGYPIPNMNYLFSLLKNAKYYSVFDALKGFWQLPLSVRCRDLSGFSTTIGCFCWTRLPMGMKSSPMVWQAEMDKVFYEEMHRHFLCYIDDGLTYSNTFEAHLIHLEGILRKCKQAGLSLSLAKCKFGYTEVKLLGYIVNQEGLKMDPAKIQRIVDWPAPKNTAEVNRFIGIIQLYRRFLPKLSEKLEVINNLRKKGVKFEWTKEHEASFQTCKTALITDPIMRDPDFEREFILLCDASNIAIAGVLAQVNEEDPKLYLPIYFGSKALTESEKKISTYEKEFLAIVYFVHFFKLYLLGKKFIVYTDQKSLQFLMKFNEDASAKLVRWQASLLAYDFDIIYKAGTSNVHADMLSRLPAAISQGPTVEAIMADYYLPLNVVRKEPESGFDQEGVVEKRGKSEVEYLQEQQIVGASDNFPERRKVVRSNEVLKVLQDHHDHVLVGHQGINRTFDLIKMKYYWPGYCDSVRAYVQSCKICQAFLPKVQGVPLNPVEFSTRGAFDKIGMDYIYTPKTAGENCAALVIIDYLTAWVYAEPVSTQSASSTCLVLYHWICDHGCPSQVIVNNGLHFSAREAKEYLSNTYGIHLSFGSLLKKYVAEYASDWDAFLPAALFVMRTMYKVQGAYSPFVLVYGRLPQISSQEIEDIYEDGDENDEDEMIKRINQLMLRN